MAATSQDIRTSLLADLPSMMQSIATQRRSGVLILTDSEKNIRHLCFHNGFLTALGGSSPDFFAKCLIWSNVVDAEQVAACLEALGPYATHEGIADHLLSQSIVTNDGLLDVLDCYIEESFFEAFSWESPAIHFKVAIPADSWLSYQMAAGTSVNTGALLLESLRRSDEMAQIAPLLPDPWDVVVVNDQKPVPLDLNDDARIILNDWRELVIGSDLLEHRLLPPFRSRSGVAELRRLGIIYHASPEKIIAHAEEARADSRYEDAYGLYCRAHALGVNNDEIHLRIGELAELFDDNAIAASSYIESAALISDSTRAVELLQNALRLSQDRLPALQALLSIHQQRNDRDEASALLLDIAELHKNAGHYDLAIQAVTKAQEYGAQDVICESLLADYSLAAGYTDQAVVYYEYAAKSAQSAGLTQQALAAWRALIAINPDHIAYSKECAILLEAQGSASDAIPILREAIRRAKNNGDDVLIPLYELLARLDSSNPSSHDWLAHAYSRRRDRDGAAAQLLVVADMQENSGDLQGLTLTLERITSMGGVKPDIWVRLAGARSLTRQSHLAAVAWCSAIEAYLELGQIPEAQKIAARALEDHAQFLPLRILQTHIAQHGNNTAELEKAFRAAADIARGSGEEKIAQEMLQQLARLRPDDLLVRIELAELACVQQDENLDLYYREVVRASARTGNQGFAVHYARRRIETAVGVDALSARSELVETLRLSGDSAGELAEGSILLDLLMEYGAFEQAIQLLNRLVASHNRNAALVLQLAEILEAMDNEHQAQRLYRHAAVLFQANGDVPESRRILERLQHEYPEDESIVVALKHIDLGMTIDWDHIRQEVFTDHKKLIEEQIDPPEPSSGS